MLPLEDLAWSFSVVFDHFSSYRRLDPKGIFNMVRLRKSVLRRLFYKTSFKQRKHNSHAAVPQLRHPLQTRPKSQPIT